jgi:serine O-acetyltransferase
MNIPLERHGLSGVRQLPLNLDRIVLALRALRKEWRQSVRPDGVTYELPSQDILTAVVKSISAALFPRHFGPSALTEDNVDDFIGQSLGEALHLLHEQVRRELRLAQISLGNKDDLSLESQAESIVIAFSENLPNVRALLESDVQAAFRGDPAARSVDEVLLCYPGIKAIIHHRLAHELYRLGATLIARLIAENAHSVTGIDIHPGATIGGRFFIDHGTGVVIGETAIIGQNVRIYQAVTLGAKRFTMDETGALVKGMARHPNIEDDVIIYAGATILGRITVGKGSTIGGNVWLTATVPPGSNITQTQARNDIFIGGDGI